jgi:hypothetical protein
MSTVIFGTVVEIKQLSSNGRLQRKKYIGVWRWEQVVTSRMIIRFPSIETMYMDRNIPKSTCCSSVSSENPMS